MPTLKEKIKDINWQISVIEKSLKGGGPTEAMEWGKKYLIKLQKKREKLKLKQKT